VQRTHGGRRIAATPVGVLGQRSGELGTTRAAGSTTGCTLAARMPPVPRPAVLSYPPVAAARPFSTGVPSAYAMVAAPQPAFRVNHPRGLRRIQSRAAIPSISPMMRAIVQGLLVPGVAAVAAVVQPLPPGTPWVRRVEPCPHAGVQLAALAGQRLPAARPGLDLHRSVVVVSCWVTPARSFCGPTGAAEDPFT